MANLGNITTNPRPDPSQMNRAQRRRLAKLEGRESGRMIEMAAHQARLDRAKAEKERLEKKQAQKAEREKSRRMGLIYN